MLFHVTMTHKAKYCPAYNHEEMPNMVEALKKMETLAKGLSVKILFIVWAAPEHVAYALLETDRLGNLAQFVNSIPIRQEFRVTPVENAQQMAQTSEALMKRNKKG